MRVFIGGSLIGLTLAGTVAVGSAWAQETGQTGQMGVHDQIELTRAEIQTRRQEIIGSMMELTPEESKAFWPVYREFRNEIAKLGDERVKFIERFATGARTMSDQEARELLDQWFKIRERHLEIQKKYLDRFLQVLPGAKVARFYQVENALDTIVSANLQASMPVAGDTASVPAAADTTK